MGIRYAILGAGGSFGIATAKYLLEQPDTDFVAGIGRNPLRGPAFSLGIVADNPGRYAYSQVHVRFEQEALFELFDFQRPEVIINFAAQGEGAVSWKHSWRYFDTNAVALAMMVEEIAKRDYFKRWIQIGTSELYGSVTTPSNETDRFVPTSPYAASKAAADMHLMAMFKTKKFPMNIIRPSNAYAPGQLLHRIIPRAVVCGLDHQKLPLQGGGVARKSYIHARDLARAIHLVTTKAEFGKVYNAGPPEPVSIRDVVETVARALEMPFEELCDMTPARFGEDSMYWLDSTAIEEDLGWEPEITLEAGVADMVAWGMEYLPELLATPQSYTFRA